MSHAISATAQNSRPLQIAFAFALTFTYFIVEVIGGVLTGSLALLADAAHMLTDVGGLGLALFAGWMSRKAASPARTYGYYRVEILAAAANALVLFAVSFWILYEAWQRFQAPPAVSSVPMLAIAVVGLAALTVVSSWLLVHTVLALHYAHVSYHVAEEARGKPPDAGLIFPATPQPDFLDFAYFSFVIGMTFQVSDVQITSRRLRRIVLLHGLLSFWFNTVIFALSINLASSLFQK